MSGSLNERRMLVTGASSGIGAAVARAAAARGARVVLPARRREPLDPLAADLSSANGPGSAVVVPTDTIDDDAAVADAVAHEPGLQAGVGVAEYAVTVVSR